MHRTARSSSGLVVFAGGVPRLISRLVGGCGAGVRGLVVAWGLIAALAIPAQAQINDGLPKEVVGVDVIERLNESLPLDALFRDERGNVVKLGDYFASGRPAVLVLHYSNCPMLCNQLLTGLVEGLKGVDNTVGEKFDVIAASIDPTEQPERALKTKTRYVQQYDRPGSAPGWHFLTGSDATIRRLAQAVGYQYNYLKEKREYSHAAVVMICTPEGRVSRYLYGVTFDPPTLRLSLLEAADGKFSSTLDRFILFCFHYDPQRGRYTAAAMRLMQLGGLSTLTVMSFLILPYWRRRGREEPEQPGDEPQQPSDASAAPSA